MSTPTVATDQKLFYLSTHDKTTSTYSDFIIGIRNILLSMLSSYNCISPYGSLISFFPKDAEEAKFTQASAKFC